MRIVVRGRLWRCQSEAVGEAAGKACERTDDGSKDEGERAAVDKMTQAEAARWEKKEELEGALRWARGR